MRIQRLSDEAIAEQLGDALRERRLRKGITQDELANLVGVSTPTIRKLEKGRGALQLLIAVLRELNSLDLLSSLTALPRVSPLAVAKTGKVVRMRAAGGSRSDRIAVQPIAERTLGDQSTKRGEKPLLIPRK
ncbi:MULTISPECIES: helix-turn-helix transcriptional regulator [Pseudomonas]|uniref:helix-turn-helix transcriptional regulator n=1 Tax=Pseudomonas TaxID=286 RepID=UPI00027BCD71|nr:helix-turn-helix domain-containing protein [Pseudomonas putida]EJT85490.1 XRE family transcriptional regulator [Pseudomonas putida S11]MDZ5111408.1 helix-turn-helix domain-containing protein [Pseudomonas putida]GLO53634.1 transcriptional regulator [Pseudomonas putida]